MTSFVYGCDPELFVSQGGVFKSGFGLIPGNKANPYKVNKGAVQVDGMALELNIEPASTEDEFVGNLGEVMKQLQEMVPDFQIVAAPVAHFEESYLKAQPMEALELGCDPDFNAWLGGEVNPRPDGNVTFRTGAGHIHIGWTKNINPNDPEHKEACCMIVKQLDCLVGVLSVLFDDNAERRQLYGKAGAYRPKKYGVEYRVLSNKWMGDERLTRLVYKAVDAAVQDLVEGIDYLDSIGDREALSGYIVEAINSSSRGEAIIALGILEKKSPRVKSVMDSFGEIKDDI